MIIAQLSDPHITLSDQNSGADTAIHFQRAIEHLLRLPAPPDVVIITGDCVNNGTIAEYQRFRELLRPLTMPVYVIPGNHDDRIHLHSIFGDQGSTPLEGFVQYVVDTGPVRLIALDTNIPGRSEGLLDELRLQWLEQRLAEVPDHPTLLFMHHPPFRTGLRVFDEIGLGKAEAFSALVARHPQVELIVAGHIHTTMVRRFHGSLAMTCPATAHHFFPDFQQPDKLVVIQEPPRCLVHVWDDGLMTYTSLIGDHGPSRMLHDGNGWV